MRVIDPWEEHCTECGEPECYAHCPKFARSATGRCARFERGIEWRRSGGTWERVVAFRQWGKLELLWHGAMASERLGRVFDFFDRRLAPLMCRLGLFRRWRSFRWRLGRWIARRGQSPAVWRVECTADSSCSLAASVVTAGGEEIYRAPMELKGGVKSEFTMVLPPFAEGALLRITAAEGSGGDVVFHRLELCDALPAAAGAGVKVVAWDLDGTLWDGILVEDGPGALKVKDDVLAIIKALDERGVVSSIVSKNDHGPALAVLKEKGLEELFVYPQISWGAKSIAIKRLAAEMNIGLDAVAFVDDSEHERREVAAELPEVRVYDRLTPADIAGWGSSDGYGTARRISYRAEMARRDSMERDFGGDAAAFLAASALVVETAGVDGDSRERCMELLQRTNQLNISARRYSADAFEELLKTAECVAVRAHDRYGDYGVVGFVARRGRHLVECCFSCRIAGKGVERRVLAGIAGGSALTADIVATDRNAPMRKIVEEFL